MKTIPNRSIWMRPAIYADTTSNWDVSVNGYKTPYSLDIFDVSFLHFHNTLELGACISGEGICYLEGQEFEFHAGDVQIIFPFQRHLSKSTGARSSKWYWLNLDPIRVLLTDGYTEIQQVDWWLHNEMGLCGIVHPGDYPKIVLLVEQIIFTNCHYSGIHAHQSQYLTASLYLLILEMCEASRALPLLKLNGNMHLNSLLPALDQVKHNLENNTKSSIAILADSCCMSISNFRKRFKNSIGLSPKEYVIASCIRKARQLLLTSDEKISTIGQSIGFDNISGFNKCFKDYVGMTPSEFRKGKKREL